ncbi:AraC family transcriptional regulator [Rhodoferax sp. GW822-FHT02A01]|uniref:AraC family transcriptional regulator n=1 Tax=Rhodoferax sp. GW822-FHT02A01 TaxID=3141537 RepID=UPI00315D8FDA
MLSDYRILLHCMAKTPGLLETIFDTFPDVLFFVKDLEGRYIWGNSVLVNRSGFKSRDGILGKTADDLFPASGQSTMTQDMQVITSKRPIEEALRMYRVLGGARYWCLSSRYPLFNDKNEVVGLFGLSRDLPRPNERHRSYFRLAKFLEYIDKNIGEGVLIADAAKQASISMDTLARLVYEVYHLKPKQLLMKKRIDQACQLLEQTSQSISEISSVCGYVDQSAFTRQFKVATHITPAQYRVTHQAAQVIN